MLVHPRHRETVEPEPVAGGQHRVGERGQLLPRETAEDHRHEEGRQLIIGNLARGVVRDEPGPVLGGDGVAVPLVLDQRRNQHSVPSPGTVTRMFTRSLVAGLLVAAAPAGPLAAQSVADHVGMGVSAIETHDLRTGLAHFEAALALDSTDYAANWRAAFA